MDLFEHPYLKVIGDFGLYGSTEDGGCFNFSDSRYRGANPTLMAKLAAEHRNPHHQWYVKRHPPQDVYGFLWMDPDLVAECVRCAAEWGACVPGIPADDTIKKADSQSLVAETVDRSGLWLIQTPQVFRTDLLHHAHQKALRDGCSVTDDAALVERVGHRVKIITGSKINVKITTASDLRIAEALLGAPRTSRQ